MNDYYIKIVERVWYQEGLACERHFWDHLILNIGYFKLGALAF